MDELAHKSATELLALIRQRALSSEELLRVQLARVARLNPEVNAVVTLDAERALERARELDRCLWRGEIVGPLHGLPITIKDAYETAGMRTTGGAKRHSAHVPERNATAVQRLVDAGAVVFGKTNVPEYSADVQTYNELFGTTRNPHDLERTPGGSSGGAAVSVACGFSALELGSDIGGSIRHPANWTGVYGHKSSYGLIPTRGHIPGPPGALSEVDLNVAGPLARSAEDLSLALSVVAGPDTARAKAYRLSLPEPRRRALSDYRVAAWLDDPRFPVSREVSAVLERAVGALERAGVRVDTAARPALDFSEIHDNYLALLNPIMVMGMPKAVLDDLTRAADALEAAGGSPLTRFARAAMERHVDWLRENERRARHNARWAEFFERFDVLLCPVSVVPAIAHDQSEGMGTREIDVDGKKRPYLDLLGWISPATASHLPATVAPAGRTRSGLPVGVQIVGPYLEDQTPIDFARRIAEVVGRFEPPPVR